MVKRQKNSVKITELAKNNVFINSHINGGLEIGGHNNSFINTTVGNVDAFKREHPFWFWFTALGTLIGIVTGLMFLAQYFNFLSTGYGSAKPVSTNIENSTSTIYFSTILSKKDDFSTSLERQNFFENYKDTEVSVDGYFKDISRNGGTYFVYLIVDNEPVACSFVAEPKTEKRLLLFKNGEKVSFLGKFTGGNINGIAWYIRDCVL